MSETRADGERGIIEVDVSARRFATRMQNCEKIWYGGGSPSEDEFRLRKKRSPVVKFLSICHPENSQSGSMMERSVCRQTR